MFIIIKFKHYISNMLHELTTQVGWLTAKTNAV